MDSLKHKLHRDSEQHRTENVRIMQVCWAPAPRCVPICLPSEPADWAQQDTVLL